MNFISTCISALTGSSSPTESESEVAQSCPALCNPMDYIAYQASLTMGFSRQEYWSGLPFPSPGDLPDQGLNPGLPHCRQTLYPPSHQGSPNYLLMKSIHFCRALIGQFSIKLKTVLLGFYPLAPILSLRMEALPFRSFLLYLKAVLMPFASLPSTLTVPRNHPMVCTNSHVSPITISMILQ